MAVASALRANRAVRRRRLEEDRRHRAYVYHVRHQLNEHAAREGQELPHPDVESPEMLGVLVRLRAMCDKDREERKRMAEQDALARGGLLKLLFGGVWR